MRSFSRLVVNEWLKMSKKRSFFVPYALIAGVIALLLYLMSSFAPPEQTLSMLDLTAMVVSQNGMGQMLTFLAIICTAGVVAKEHSLGTIKLLLIRAQSRSKILASKYVAVLLFTLSICAFAFVVALLGGGAIFGFEVQGTSWSEVLQTLLYQLVYTIVYVTITFMVGIFTKSSGATIGIGMSLILLESLIVTLLSRYEIAKYLVFANTDLSVYLHGNPPMSGMSLTFSVLVLAAYMILFLAASFVTFKKRDVA
ncbi:ABC transporter permease [Paenibacillus macerans]|uniref:ABC transporter permease n=1 Tax=Paenibacillus macerans TaxID=44252 RepID=UPI003D323CB3